MGTARRKKSNSNVILLAAIVLLAAILFGLVACGLPAVQQGDPTTSTASEPAGTTVVTEPSTPPETQPSTQPTPPETVTGRLRSSAFAFRSSSGRLGSSHVLPDPHLLPRL
jgi:hypothetical protein